MALSRAEADIVFQHALGLVRRNRRGGGITAETPAQLAARIYQRQPGGGGYTRQDALAAVNRAIGANAAGRAMNADPDNPTAVLRRALPNKPVLNRRSGDYEYQVVLRMTGATGFFETRYVIQVRNKRSANQLFDMAQKLYREETALQDSYRNRVAAVGPLPTPTAWVISATFFDPTRKGTQ
jgi:hypothetical protein